MDADLILWADAPSDRWGYLQPMQFVRAVRRDVRANRWDYALTGAMIVAAIIVLATQIDADSIDAGSHAAPTVAGWAATIGVCCTLIGRRRWPLRCFAIASVLLFVLGLTDNSDSVAFLAMLIGLYSAAESLPLRQASGAAVMVLALVAGSVVAFENEPTVGVIVASAAFALGRLIRGRRTRQDHEATVARRRAIAAIEIADLAAAEDRQRMAQELHDVVAHSLSVIAVRAGIGAHLIDREPDEAARALDAIRATSSAATDELARLIVLLRNGDGTGAEAPPTLADIEALCAQVSDSRLPIELVVDGDLQAVPAGVSLAAYRIVQEALTNVVRHAGPATAKVHVRVTPSDVEIDVEDDGRGAHTSPEPERVGAGHGLVGMTERAEMYGGRLIAGPRPGGGFRVRAVLRTFVDAAEVAVPASDPIDDATPTTPKIPALAWDVGLALVFTAFAVWELIAGGSPDLSIDESARFATTNGWAWVFEIGCCLALVGRRRRPATALLASTVLGLALTIGDHSTSVIVLAFIVGLYSVGGYATTTRFIAALVGIVVALGIVAWSDPPDMDAIGVIWTGMIATAAAVTGFVVRREREARDARIAEHLNAGIDESRRARLAATTERLHVAEELDRVINRTIDSISVAANTGSRVVATDPAAALALLDMISTTSRDALAELRRVLKRMRIEGDAVPHAPAPAVLSANGPVQSR